MLVRGAERAQDERCKAPGGHLGTRLQVPRRGLPDRLREEACAEFAARVKIPAEFTPGLRLGTGVAHKKPLYVRYEQTVLTIVGPRQGKTTALCVPMAVAHAGPLLECTNKPDLHATTRGPRSRMGKVYVHDMQQIAQQGASFWWKRNMRQLVLPVFEHYALREITVGRVDRFLKALAASKSCSTAKQAKTVLSLAFGLAVRYDVLRENPVRETAKLHKPATEAKALTVEEINVIREAAGSWRRGAGFSGPPPDGQLEQIIEVMLGTSARIGEVLAIRKCDVDVTVSPATVRICGTIVSPKGKPTHRQRHPKTQKSTRTVSVVKGQ